MTKNPFLNALSASAYIVFVAGIMSYVSETQRNQPDTIFAPMMFLSLLTLSVAVMAWAFFYQPAQLLLAGKKKEASQFLIRTIGSFAVLTGVIFILVLLGGSLGEWRFFG